VWEIKSSVLCPEIFAACAKSAQKLEVRIQDSSIRTSRFNCRLMTEYKFRSDAGFICDKTPAKFFVLNLEI